MEGFVGSAVRLGQDVFVAHGAVVMGDVTMGEGSSVWYNAVLRGDEAPIRMGTRTNVQDNAVIHVDQGCPASIGNGVTIGHGAIVHGCTIGDNTVIGMGAIVLNGATVGDDCIIGAGALVTQGKEIPSGHLAFGNPARVVRPLTPAEIEANRRNADTYVRLAAGAASGA